MPFSEPIHPVFFADVLHWRSRTRKCWAILGISHCLFDNLDIFWRIGLAKLEYKAIEILYVSAANYLCNCLWKYFEKCKLTFYELFCCLSYIEHKGCTLVISSRSTKIFFAPIWSKTISDFIYRVSQRLVLTFDFNSRLFWWSYQKSLTLQF